MRGFAALLAVAALTACASAGTQVSEQQAAAFKPGQTTYADVVAALGPPTATSAAADGTRIAVYSYSAVQSRPENFLPIVGPLVGGYDATGNAVTFTFDSHGKLSNTATSQTNLAVNRGPAAAR